ncbi:helix-turn-helix domain-containing protein [Streptomyces sp. NPDC051561]|uniref:helix-turn-helix domain-containing protein n=1 Tax=Streptomyces sp. NPDC051561 TaxID=3365658 RepID=UPI0037A913D4
MVKPIGTTAPRLKLGIQMRELRQNSRYTIEDAAKAVPGLNYDKLRRIELGKSSFRQVSELRKLLELYGVGDDVELAAALEELYKTPTSQDWTTQFRGVPDGTRTLASIESEANEFRAYHPNLVPAQLQCKAYAEALHRDVQPVEETTSEMIEGNVALRMIRRKPILRTEEPAKLWAIIGEAALRHPVGTKDVMREQYEEILGMAALPHVTVQVLLTDAPVKRLWSNFTILDLGRERPVIVQVDTPWGTSAMTDKSLQVARFNRWFSTMTASAERPEETPAFIETLKRVNT